jgi:hypothetical protein
MKLSITADIDLHTPGGEHGFVTRFDVRAYAPDLAILGTARIALVHVGEIADARADLWSVLHAARLDSIADTYFADGWYTDDYADGAGIDLLFVENVTVEARAKNLDLAIVRRLADTIASGCQLVSLPYRDAHEAARWSQIGFASSTPGRSSGLLHLKLGYHHARLVPAGGGAFEVLAGPADLGLRRVAN